MEYPGNSYTMRGKMKRVAIENPEAVQNANGYYYVKVKYLVWPKIYGNHPGYPFPTLEAALRFAQGNVSPNTPVTSVYSPYGTLVETFTARRF